MYKKEKGFTLLELLAVLIIMSILAYMAIPLYDNTVDSIAETNISNQVKSVLDVAASTARANLKKVKVRFEQDKIELIQMDKVSETWIDDSILDVIDFDEGVEVSSEDEVIYDIDGFPEENKTIDITSNRFNIQVDVYTDGRITLQDI